MLVDTSVWIDFFAARKSWQTQLLTQTRLRGERIFVPGIVMTEILQGFRTDTEFRQVQSYLLGLRIITPPPGAYILAAQIYRNLRSRGITVRSTIDCIIAATAIEFQLTLLHNDRDFEFIEKHSQLEVVSPS